MIDFSKKILYDQIAVNAHLEEVIKSPALKKERYTLNGNKIEVILNRVDNLPIQINIY